VSRLLYFSLAISAWKQAGRSDYWSLRVNPSSGDLHPTESYWIGSMSLGLVAPPGVYHYSPLEHALEERLRLPYQEWCQFAAQIPDGGFLMALTSIYWRESWKYGERAFRYCHHDVGHAIGTLAIAAATLGWRVQVVETLAGDELDLLLGLHHQSGPEREHSDCLIAVMPVADAEGGISIRLPDCLREWLKTCTVHGEPNQLSPSHHAWPVIDEVAEATRSPGRCDVEHSRCRLNRSAMTEHAPARRNISAHRLIRKRRSAVAMDGMTTVARLDFYRMMERVLPGNFPFAALRWPPTIALAILVHRVAELQPGLYILARDPAQLSSLRASTRHGFRWERPASCPTELNLYMLELGDVRQVAALINCHQTIAANGAFALAMLAEIEQGLENYGPCFYPRMFWETGLIGQVLYLEAEAAGVRATGIGCFFDDAMHQLLGIQDRSWQSLYHFTVGGAVDDTRLQSIPAYAHLGEQDLDVPPKNR
jgi:SagB-type dehydrogenase family enzyme